MKVLLERHDVNPNKPDIDGRTPLLYAAWNGHEGVVKLLLGRDEVSPERPDNDGRTPLSYAAGNGYAGVAEILLARNVAPRPTRCVWPNTSPHGYSAWPRNGGGTSAARGSFTVTQNFHLICSDS